MECFVRISITFGGRNDGGASIIEHLYTVVPRLLFHNNDAGGEL